MHQPVRAASAGGKTLARVTLPMQLPTCHSDCSEPRRALVTACSSTARPVRTPATPGKCTGRTGHAAPRSARMGVRRASPSAPRKSAPGMFDEDGLAPGCRRISSGREHDRIRGRRRSAALSQGSGDRGQRRPAAAGAAGGTVPSADLHRTTSPWAGGGGRELRCRDHGLVPGPSPPTPRGFPSTRR